MSPLEFVASLVSSLVTLAWPAAAIVLGLLFMRSQQPALARLIDRIKSLKAGPFEATLPAESTPGAQHVLARVGEAPGTAEGMGSEKQHSDRQVDAEVHGTVPQVTMSREDLELILTQYGQAGWDIAQMGMFNGRPRPVIKWDENGVPQLVVWTARRTDSIEEPLG
ncbi:hypothetical protein [Promicromonospora sp. AC04]|uniref:hypothetical protein n=1 Tax=Promicromonospora sp. AC04 TaxID=2135723 RepID=UPI000D339C0B|nr:hypothetical protein [Promicromonospora sp. AC04]